MSAQKNNERQLAESYRTARERIKTELSALDTKDNLKPYQIFQKQRLKGLLNEVEKQLTKLTGETLTDGVKKNYKESFESSNNVITDLVGDKIKLDKPSKKQVEEAVKNPYDKVGFLKRNQKNNKENTEKLRKEITTGIIQGKSYKDIAKIIDKRFDVGFNNAVRISRTEGHRARESGNIDSFRQAKEMGINIKKQWITAEDERVRDAHAELNGVTIDVDDVFTVDGYSTSEPGGFGVAELDINCRCTLVAVIE